MSNEPFIELALKGYVLVDEIDDFVAEWHSSKSKKELHDFLGMTFEEYSLWASNADTIYTIITARRAGISLREAVNDDLKSQDRIAARADEAGKFAILQKWIDAQPDR